MEALTRIVSDSLARYGLDRPVDPRRLQWSRWFRCDSPHSLLLVPSKPGIFAIAEEIMDLGSSKEPVEAAAIGTKHVGTAALGCPAEQSSAVCAVETSASAAEVISKRMLAVLQFSEDDNMAYVLDRMFTHINPMRARLHTGDCFVRFVVVEDQPQRRTICAALNQWMRNSAEKAAGFATDFSSSLEMPRVGQALSFKANGVQAPTKAIEPGKQADYRGANQSPDSGSSKNLHCPHPLPSGF